MYTQSIYADIVSISPTLPITQWNMVTYLSSINRVFYCLHIQDMHSRGTTRLIVLVLLLAIGRIMHLACIRKLLLKP